MEKTLPRELTSYDLLKTLAVVLMLVDHLGAYYFPGHDWMRVLGRLCVPMWFFLIGYARSRDLGWPIWAGAVAVIATDVIAGLHIFPMNILVSIIAVRLLLDGYAWLALKGPFFFCAGAVFLALATLPAAMLVDYGAMGLILAFFGYLCRHQGGDPARRELVIFPYMIFCIVSYVFMQWLLFDFAMRHVAVLFAGTIVVLLALSDFRPAVLPRLTAALPGAAVAMLKVTGRQTLLIYVGHLILMRLIGLAFFPDRFRFMEWRWLAYMPH